MRDPVDKDKNLSTGAGSRHGQGWAKPTQMIVLPTQSELDKDCVNLLCSD